MFIDGTRVSVYKQTEVIPKLCHSFSEWKTTSVDKASGITTQTRTCSACKLTETRTIIGSATRLAGKNRFETAAKISEEGFKKADTVVLAYGFNYADALAGVPLAQKLGAPILLTQTDKLPDETAAEIQRLGAKKAVILGGEGVISTSVENTLKKQGITTQRYSLIGTLFLFAVHIEVLSCRDSSVGGNISVNTKISSRRRDSIFLAAIRKKGIIDLRFGIGFLQFN